MRIETLLTPGEVPRGLQLRSEAAKAISAAEQYLDTAGKATLAAFFTDCAAKVSAVPAGGLSATIKP